MTSADSQTWLVVAAAGIAFFHTLLGPDHYLPFVGMGRALRWSRARLAGITLLCGLGHVLSSLVLGLIGITLGLSLARLQAWENARGAWASYGLVGFGLAYFAWGMTRAGRRHEHHHPHVHADGTVHAHTHSHELEHLHPHFGENAATKVWSGTVWMLFSIFLLGPCEPLIPLFIVPAAAHNWHATTMVALLFTAVTLATMLAVVMVCSYGLERVRLPALEPYSHAVAGATIAMCGIAISLFGL